ncbi:hypothetical protein SX4_0925 [Vibrio mimicus SX-4]|nr:hypothetical protein SX4_0925 [Vibrio mimicus SX-4]
MLERDFGLTESSLFSIKWTHESDKVNFNLEEHEKVKQ